MVFIYPVFFGFLNNMHRIITIIGFKIFKLYTKGKKNAALVKTNIIFFTFLEKLTISKDCTCINCDYSIYL